MASMLERHPPSSTTNMKFLNSNIVNVYKIADNKGKVYKRFTEIFFSVSKRQLNHKVVEKFMPEKPQGLNMDLIGKLC